MCLALAASGCGYNQLVSQNEKVDSAWSEVQNQLQRRNDLIPNLVSTVKGFAAQEQNVLVKVTEARSRVAGAGTPSETMAASNELSGALSRLLVVVEKYPELKSDRNFIQLQDELAGTENRLAVARNRYNDAVREYNTTAKRFPDAPDRAHVRVPGEDRLRRTRSRARSAEGPVLTPTYTLRELLGYFLRLGSARLRGADRLVGAMQRDLVETRGWIRLEDFKEGLALAQLAPGPLAAQLAIYLGWVHHGFVGATLVAFAFVLPSFAMVMRSPPATSRSAACRG